MGDGSDTDGTKTGRPRKRDGPKVPYDEIDRLLVHGEVVKAEAGGTTVVYPSYRNLAARYGCAHSLIAQYSRKHDCLRRRKETRARVVVKAEQKLVEMRANAIAISKDDALQIIDAYLAGFGEAISEGRVRFDNPTDFNTMLRLKEFILGGADSRQEIHAALSLEDIQARHQRMLREAQASTSAVRGELLDAEVAPALGETEQALAENSPAPPAEAAAGEVPGQFPGAGAAPPPATPHGPVSAAGRGAVDDEASGGGSAPHRANVAPTGPSSGPSPAASTPASPDAAIDAAHPGAEPPEKVCASSSPSSASLVGEDDDGQGDDGRSRSSAALRPPPDEDGDEPRAPVASSRVLPRPCDEGVGEGSRASGEHAPDLDGAS